MPKLIRLDLHPIGYAAAPSFDDDETVLIRPKEFLSSEDGADFITRLDGLSECYAAAFAPDGVPRSQVDHFLAVVKPDREATVYVNELRLATRCRVRREKPEGRRVGDLVFTDDIAEADELNLLDAEGRPVEIPADCGFSLILSYGWRKGLYYDYSTFGPYAKPRTDNLPKLFGHFITRLMFQEMYAIDEGQWTRLIASGWFPFLGIGHADRKRLLAWAKQDRTPDSVFEEIARNFAADLPIRFVAWERYEYLKPRMPFLTRARERFEAQDYLSCINLLYPQIEGVMRALYVDENPAERATQETMASNLVENQYAHSVLLPNRFEEYLGRVYFRGFDLQNGIVPLSRHTVGHGVSAAGDYTFVRAAVGFMTLDQLVRYLSD